MGRWRRKQSGSSGDSNTLSESTTTEGSESRDLTKTSSGIMRALTGGFRSSSKPKKSKESPEDARLNRPFTHQNLEHQKILNAFAFNFGKRKLSHGARSSVSGVSPGASRNASFDSHHLPPTGLSHHHGDRRDTHPRFNSSLAGQAPREVPGEESDKEQTEAPTDVLTQIPHH
ncbi:hypothetical protein JX265_002326 [Neoarthrinium moseri]|uniref:Uncharacterized protein n=1 Tax=Neoarthrinium moseri TaxID=1658444 RepID=A0A9Q0ATE2_9PEZI|nr:uncharacterized protein JN550_000138 [Neoarthrinium moseri]KAI1877956.1 hypothetical protein JN550_000138 [Neoarthrinium moseri]KAI1879372.1 hypothetical protein JX265_002326 [Neoarthrinium moseri]